MPTPPEMLYFLAFAVSGERRQNFGLQVLGVDGVAGAEGDLRFPSFKDVLDGVGLQFGMDCC